MSETKWTRGPWRIEPDANVVWGECDPDDLTTRGYGIPVAELSMHKPRWASGKSELNWQANAHLIAAAPELYEALAYLAERVHLLNEYEQAALDKANAALAKARGETSNG